MLAWFMIHVDRTLDRPLAFGDEVRHHIIPRGTSFTNIVVELEREGIVANALALEIYARWSGLAGGVQAGEYAIDPAMNLRELLTLFHSGKVVQHSLTLVDGWTFDEVLLALRSRPELDHTLGSDLGHAEIMSALGYAGVHPEGRFLADT